ncbi:MAG: pallilysin-related adhesin [Spirochaetaceae bacterium]|jgi:hypothetical protein|nr:pallilysin-related adhesin [Spirochaetaceae bacterium]
MITKTFRIFTFTAFILAFLCIIGLLVFPRLPFAKKESEARQSRVIVPLAPASGETYPGGNAERMAYEDDISAKIALKEGESLVSVLTGNFDGDPLDEQIVAYRKSGEIDGPVYIAYVDFDDDLGGYRRVWDFSTPLTRQGTLNLYTVDMIGDRSICLVIMGMNNDGEQTLTVLQKKTVMPRSGRDNTPEAPFLKIAELRVDGSISIRELERTTAYQLGYTRGEPFTIAAHGRDADSQNLMDQIETVYAYNRESGLYERQRTVRIPGAQIEQRLLRELLSGSASKFEEFIDGLWYYVNNDGTLDQKQYIYFDPENREIIFFGDQIQQVFSWRSSSPTRYGLYISSQNVSVVTLTRFLELELESLEGIRLRVVEDVRIKIGVSDPWNGSYRKAGTVSSRREQASPEPYPYIDSVYSGYIGKMTFDKTGSYSLDSGTSVQRGRYAFFMLGDTELLELRSGTDRNVYRVNWGEGGRQNQNPPPAELTLVRVRLSTRGIQELHETAISMTMNPEA